MRQHGGRHQAAGLGAQKTTGQEEAGLVTEVQSGGGGEDPAEKCEDAGGSGGGGRRREAARVACVRRGARVAGEARGGDVNRLHSKIFTI